MMITEILKLIAPGTPIRDGLENILKAKTGALIVISDTKEVLDLVDGGFRLDIDYTSSRLYVAPSVIVNTLSSFI